MDYKTALELVENVRYGHSEDSSNFKRVLAMLDLNIDSGKIIQIAGTNGKGSVGTFLATMLKEQGYTVEHFSSPHLEIYEERIKIDLKPIGRDVFVKAVEEILRKIEVSDLKSLNYFEVSYLLALQIMHMKNPDYFIVETGIGGRFDITNIFEKNLLSIITTIGYDHQDQLGNTLESIAFHKSGIIKKNGKVVSFEHEKSVDEVIKKEAMEKNANLAFLRKSDYKIEKSDLKGSTFSFYDLNFKTQVLGLYQVQNISLAVLALYTVLDEVDVNKLQIAVNKLHFEGRMEIIMEKPLVILDGAHNLEGIASLSKNVEELNLNDYYLIVGSMSDKNIVDSLGPIIERAKKIIITKIDYERAMEPSKLKKDLSRFHRDIETVDKVADVCKFIVEEIPKDAKVIITGSLYLIGEFRNILKGE